MRILHTMLRVRDLEKSVDFYTKILHMKELRRRENIKYRYTLVFIGYGDDVKDSATIELTYNWDIKEYDLGTAYGHIAIEVPDIEALCAIVREYPNAKVTREPGKVKGTNSSGSTIAFIEDPDGYKLELIEKKIVDDTFYG